VLADAQANYDRLITEYLRQRALGNDTEDIRYLFRISQEVIERERELNG
jgi:hypothetical protein